MADEKIIDRIRKLQMMRVENGCSEDEAETAMRMWVGLMARHGIEQSQISKGQDAPAAIRKRVSETLRKHQLLCGQAAAVLYGCDFLVYSGGKMGVEFIGRTENTQAAEMTMFWLMNQMESFYKQALPRGLSKADRAEFRRTFKESCAARINTRAHAMVDEMKRSDKLAQETTGSNALVVLGHFDQLKKENQLVTADMNIRKGRTLTISSGSGTLAGRAAGDRVKLRKEIG